MIFALVFVCTRIAQIITLIPVMGMLSWFINIFVTANALTPDSLLILFVTSVLALAWAVFTLFSYHRSSANARFVALVDLAIFGTLIAAVVLLRGIHSE
ncbi:membrane-associating domain-containing protein [Ophiocordyceps camponoti-floridani]|uniref:Membrane-associating domain-containing protein n=1 Tax=Ophiocordyceps camponoti-floridani TaxID=2030778 RepID=A0A8H4VFW9_9HYPO|nr:membrane-associating domain-containing protein [Ophiocordyceps camponoti-floridani]